MKNAKNDRGENPKSVNEVDGNPGWKREVLFRKQKRARGRNKSLTLTFDNDVLFKSKPTAFAIISVKMRRQNQLDMPTTTTGDLQSTLILILNSQ